MKLYEGETCNTWKISPRLLIGLFYIIMVIKLASLLCWLQHFPPFAFVSNSRYFPLFPSYNLSAFFQSSPSLTPISKHLLRARLVQPHAYASDFSLIQLLMASLPTSSWLCAEKREEINGNYKVWVGITALYLIVSETKWKWNIISQLLECRVNKRRLISYSPFLADFPSSGWQAWLREGSETPGQYFARPPPGTPRALHCTDGGQGVGGLESQFTAAQPRGPLGPPGSQGSLPPSPLPPAGVTGIPKFPRRMQSFHISSCLL